VGQIKLPNWAISDYRNQEPPHLLRHARHLVMHSFPRVDIVLCTPEEIAAAQAGHAPFLRSILESGVVIYQR
jgi:hypothetical protein